MKSRNQLMAIVFSMLFLFFSSAEITYACSCRVNETVDKEVKNTSNVVVLTLQNVELLDKKSASGGNIRHSTFTVDKAFKGNLKVNEKLIFENNYSSCGWSFSEESVGKKYLFYLGEKSVEGNIWQVSPCSRSGLITDSADDLLFLEKMEKVKNKTRLSGSVTQFVQELTAEGMIGKWNYLSGRTIRIIGDGNEIKVKTDENGAYEIYDLPAGKYKLTLDKIDGYSFTNDDADDFLEAEIKAKSHTQADVLYSIKNAVRGKLYDENGKPLKGIYLKLIPSNEDFPLFYIDETYTDDNGDFEFRGVPIGSFLLVINEEDDFRGDKRFRSFFYPGTMNRSEASEIIISPGAVYENFNVKMPRSALNITK